MTSTATDKRPSSYVELSDGSTTVALMLCNSAGKDDPRGIQRAEYPRMSTRIPQGEAKYADFEWPYKSIIQEDWAGGRGKNEFELDKTRFLDSHRVITEHENQIILSGLETYATGHRNANQSMPGKMVWTGTLYGSSLYIARKFEAGANYTASKVMLWVKRAGTPTGTLNVRLCNDNAGEPGTEIAGASATLTVSSINDTISELRVFSLGTPPNLTSGTAYWVKVYISGVVPDSTNHLKLGTNPDSGSNTQTSGDGSAWSAAGEDLYFRVIDNSSLRGQFVEYKRGFYFLSQPVDGTASSLYLSGDRGVANSGTTTTLVDSDKSWATNEWQNCVVVLTKGTGDAQRQTYRTISTNTATELTVTPAWDVAPGAATEYVILGSNKWTLQQTFATYASDICVAGDAMYIAFTEGANVRLYMQYRSANAWTESEVEQNFVADKLLAIRHPSSGMTVWGSVNKDLQHGSAVWNALVPPAFNAPPTNSQLYSLKGTALAMDDVWDEQAISNVTVSRSSGKMQIALAAGFTTGVAASKRLSTPIDLTPGKKLAFLVQSSVNTSAGDLRLRIDDTQNLGDSFLVDNLWHLNTGIAPSAVYWYDATDYNSLNNLRDGSHSTRTLELPLTTTHYIYVGSTYRFNRIIVDVDTQSTATADLSGECYVGDYGSTTWQALTGFTDGTADGGKTFYKDGEITWTLPNAWNIGVDSSLTTNLSTSLYWVRLKVSAAVTATMRLGLFTLEDTDIDQYTALTKAKDGRTGTSESIDITSDDFIVVMHSEKFNKVYWNIGSTPNAEPASMSAQYFNGEAYTALTLTSDGTKPGSATLAQDGEMVFTIPADWEQITIGDETGYAVRFYPSADLTNAVELVEVYVKNDDATTINFPALTADIWNWATFAISPNANPNPDDTQIRSIGLYVNTDNGAQTIIFGSDIYLIDEYPEYIKVGNSDSRINGLEAYGDERENPWVFKEESVYEIQTNNSNLPVPIPLREIQSMRSEFNGIAHTVSDVYIVFNMNQHVERYYQHTLDDVGPNRDEGMPSGRSGTISSLVSFPGRIFAAIDAGSTGYSSMLVRRGGGWHEMYRAPYGQRINSMRIQVVPGLISRLWFNQGSDIVWIPLTTNSYNPLKDSNYTYTHEGYVVTGWVSADFLDISKLFKSVKLFTENLSGSSYTCEVEYQLETGNVAGGWTALVSNFSTSPFQEVLLSSSYDKTARRIRFRIRLFTTNSSTTPVVKAAVIEALIRLPVKYSYTMTVRLEDYPEDLVGGKNMVTRIEDVLATLDTWADAPTALTMRTVYSPFDNKRVVVEPAGMKPYIVDSENQNEAHIGSLTVLEI